MSSEEEEYEKVPRPQLGSASTEVDAQLDAAARVAAAAKSMKPAEDPSPPQQPHLLPPQRTLLQRALREGVIIALLTGLVVAWARHLLLQSSPDKLVLTPQQLARYDGKVSKRIYVAVLGEVFDVTAGAKHYGPSGNYHGAAARDASKSFITGDFKKEGSLTDDLSGHTAAELAAIHRWRSFFRDHKVYKRVGKVPGRFYTPDGAPTPELLRVEQVGGEAAAQAAAAAKPDADTACNVQWSAKGGKTVWCPQGRGYPRHIADATSMDRCVCSPTSAHSAVLMLYEGCAPESQRCVIANPGE